MSWPCGPIDELVGDRNPGEKHLLKLLVRTVLCLTIRPLPGAVTFVAQERATRTGALTSDELAGVAAPYPKTLPRVRRATIPIPKAFKKYRAPATAFVNKTYLEVRDEVDRRMELLQSPHGTGVHGIVESLSTGRNTSGLPYRFERW
jgi:hypothetical protein